MFFKAHVKIRQENAPSQPIQSRRTVLASAVRPAEDRRSSHRIRTLKAARILVNEGRSTFDCTVKNISEGGAKLSCGHTMAIPEEFELLLDSGNRYRCAVRWRKLLEIGVEFI